MSQDDKFNFHILMGDADTLANNTDPTFLILDISLADIKKRNIASALERLLVLTDKAQNVSLYRESLFFQVSGFDYDPRELVEIPEVRE
jgi:hypothetical protein